MTAPLKIANLDRRALGRKTASGDFFENPNKCTYRLSAAAQELCRVQPPTTTLPASGIPVWPSRDPIGERGGVNLYGFVDNEPISWIDWIGNGKLPTNGSEPDFGRRRLGSKDCLGYACNAIIPPNIPPQTEPGVEGYCKAVTAGMESKGATKVDCPSEEDEKCVCEEGTSLTMVYAGEAPNPSTGKYNHHGYRQDSNGLFSHSNSTMKEPSQKDADGKDIEDPRNANRGNYNHRCGCYCVPR